MKNKSPNRGLSNFYMQRLHGIASRNVLELVIPTSRFGRSKGMLENILRWEEDGDQITEIKDSTVDQKRKTQ